MGMSCVLRIEDDAFVDAKGIYRIRVYNHIEVKTIVLRESLSWLNEKQLDRVSEKSDAKLDIQGLRTSI